MTYDKLLDEVAESIFSQKSSEPKAWLSVPEFVREMYRGYAVAAIGAVYDLLREPTDAMIDAAAKAEPSTISDRIKAAVNASSLNPSNRI